MTEGVAGPYAATLLGDMGADVIKVERPEGDWGRDSGRAAGKHAMNAHFIALNRNKRDLGLDLRRQDARQVIERLLACSDVIISNYRPGVMQRLGLDYDRCRDVNPDIIYCTISAFGQEGAYAQLPGSDTVMQAVSGLMNLIGEHNGPPLRIGFPSIDLFAATYAVQGILLALYAKKEGRGGANLDVSLMNAALSLMTTPFSEYLIEGHLPGRHGNQNPSLSPAGAFKAADGKYITIAVLRESHWKKFCFAINRTDLETDSRFANNTLRLTNRDVLNEILAPIFLAKTASEWVAKLREADILCAPLNHFNEIVEDPDFTSTMPLLDITLPTGQVKALGAPVLFDGAFFPLRVPPPNKGEHTLEILSELGFSEKDVERLVQDGSVFVWDEDEPGANVK